MPYDQDKLYDKALKNIDSQNLFFMADVYAYLGISHDSFYRFFPTGSERYEEIKKRIERNRQKTKVSMRSKWYQSNTASLQISLYKLLATKEELNRLNNMQAIDEMHEYLNRLKDALQPLPEAKEGD